MELFTPPLTSLAAFTASPQGNAPAAAVPRDVSIWEITTWILPMAPEHLRRVLGQNPDLPQGRTGAEGGTRWFSWSDVAALRQHFAAVSARSAGWGKAYVPRRPTGARAPLIALTGPQGQSGRSTALLHLACAAALAGYRVLVLDADPAGQLGAQLGAQWGATQPPAPPATSLLPLIARSCGVHLRGVNASRLDRGEAPVPMDEVIAAALDGAATDATALIRPTAWPGLDVIAASPDLLLADMQIAGWCRSLRSWHPARALAAALDRAGLRSRYDLILCDTGRGLGPLVLAVLSSADVLLVPCRGGQVADGLAGLARAMALQEAEATMTARALGQVPPRAGWRRIVGLQIGPAQATATQSLPPLPALLPAPLPIVPQITAGQAAHLYALDYRAVGRLAYGPLRDGCDAAWRGLAGVLTGLWAEDAAAVSESDRAG